MHNRNAFPFAVMVILLSTAACKKTEAPAPTITTLPSTSVTQTVYQVSETSTPEKGIILAAPFALAVQDTGAIMIMDEHGAVLQKKSLPGVALDFRQWTIGGQTRFTYFVNDVNAYQIPLLNNLTGYLVVTDSLLNEITRINLLPFNDVQTADGHALDLHDFIYISDNHYIVESYYDKHVANIPAYLQPDPQNRIVAAIIQEVENGSVIWQWDSSNDTAFYNSSMFANDYTNTKEAQDYMHLNAMSIDPRDNNLIVSFRSQSQVVKIDRNTGKVLWRFGGKNSDFPLTDDQVFLFQHNAHLVDSNTTLIMFDNGDATLRPHSRILEFKLDEVNKIVTGFSSFDIPESFSAIMGSVQKFGDIYFIGGGSGNYILEVNHVTNQKIIEFTSTQSTYRAYKIPAQ